MPLAIGVDVGGTLIRAGLVDESGQLLHLSHRETPSQSSSPDEVVNTIVEVAREAQGAAEREGRAIAGIGFGLPEYSIGPNWVQTQCANIPALEGFPLYPAMRAVFGSSIACDLDTHAATLAELHFGAGVNYDRLIFMVVGTGISCGVVVDGKLLRYTFGTSGDTGHLIVDPGGAKRCTCGGRGCLETLASALAIREAAIKVTTAGESELLARIQKERGDLSAYHVSEAAREGDQAARAILTRAGRALGIALTSLMHVFYPDVILIGGGVSGAGELLLDPARQAIREFASPFYAEHLSDLRQATLGTDAGVVGAASLILVPQAS